MARRKKAGDGGGGSGDWLNTYADMVTLLLTFFILLFSMSTLDAEKFNAIVEAMAEKDPSEKIVIVGQGAMSDPDALDPGQEGQKTPDVDMQDIYRQLSEYIDQNNLQDSVSVAAGDGVLLIRFMDDMLFEPNSARLKTADYEILNFVGYGIKSIQDEAKLISINGHTAAIPGDPDYAVSDRVLSTDRANAVLTHFEDKVGIEAYKLLAIGWGKNKPFTTNETDEGRSKNRRVEILISTENTLSDELDVIYDKLVS